MGLITIVRNQSFFLRLIITEKFLGLYKTLNNNKLKRVFSNTFCNMKSLTLLKLDHNFIDSIQNNSFYNLNTREQKKNESLILDFSSNKIKKNQWGKGMRFKTCEGRIYAGEGKGSLQGRAPRSIARTRRG